MRNAEFTYRRVRAFRVYLHMGKRKTLAGTRNDMQRPYFSRFSIKTRFATYPSCLLWDITSI